MGEASRPDGVSGAQVELLLQLARRARHSESPAELGFIVANETHMLAPYRQAALWFADKGVQTLSGVVAPEANAPFVQWLDRVLTTLAARHPAQAVVVEPTMLAAEDAAEWDEWLSAQALWLPFSPGVDGSGAGGLLLSREEVWKHGEIQILLEWCDVWLHAWRSKQTGRGGPGLLRLLLRPRSGVATGSAQPVDPSPATWAERWPWLRRRLAALPREIWRSPPKRYAALAVLVLLIPVRLSVLVPGELVPAQPAPIRAPLDGTVDRFFVSPNQLVKAGEPLFQLDLTTLGSKLEVARQALATVEAEYRQSAQQAVYDARSKALLATLQGRIAEKRTEVEYIQGQFVRAQVLAPRDGVALVDDPSEWTGKPVVTGERVMTIADEHDVEVEAWLSPADMIDLPDKAAVTLYLNSAPLQPVDAHLRYAAHEAIQRPDGSFAYRLRATLAEGESRPRVGLKGTVRVSGHFVPLAYWVLRRPLASVRPWLGL